MVQVGISLDARGVDCFGDEMNRGDVKLMIDRLNSVTLSVDAEDEQTIDAAVYMLGELANANVRYKTLTNALEGQLSVLREQQYIWTQAEKTLESEREANALLTAENAKLQANLDRHMEVIVTGRKANEELNAKYSTLFNAVKNLRGGNTDSEYERLMTVIGEEK